LRLQNWLPLLVGLLAAPAGAQVVVADAGDDLNLECGSSEGTPATLDATGSTVDGASAVADPDVDFLWSAAGIDFSDASSPTPSAAFPNGTTTVTLTVTHTDPVTLAQVIAQDTVDVRVADTTPPTLSLIPDPAVLWPPNHKLREIELVVLANDLCDPDPDFTLTSVSSNEPDNGTGDGDTTGDIQGADVGTDDDVFLLRAERAGPGSGRVYTVIGNVTDESGNSTNGVTQIVVPHDQGNGKSNKAVKAAEKAAKAAEKAAEKAAKDARKAAEKAAKAAKAAGKSKGKKR
jgi:hypothetical protein